MSIPVSLGEQLYVAYWRAWPAIPLPFDRITSRERQAWERAGAAVKALVERQTQQKKESTP